MKRAVARENRRRREGFGFAVELLSELHLMDKETRNLGQERMWWEKFNLFNFLCQEISIEQN